MKRYVKAQYTGEPSASEFGHAIDRSRKEKDDKYYPFVVRLWYEKPSSSRTVGYKITMNKDYPSELADDRTTWYVYEKNWSSTFSAHPLLLYGGFDKYDPVPKWYELDKPRGVGKFEYDFCGEFKTIDQVISYLYEVLDIEIDE